MPRKAKKVATEKRHTVIRQPWWEHEYEPDWGVSDRPYGYSLHLTAEHHEKFMAKIERDAPKRRRNACSPDGYCLDCFPNGPMKRVSVNEATYRKLKRNKGYLRIWK